MAGWCKGSTLGSEPKDFGSIPDSATMRKGVQVMKKRLTSFLLVLALSFSLSFSAFAVDDSNYYSLSPVGGSEPSVALDWPVNPAEFSNDDSRTLSNIYSFIQYLTFSASSWGRDSVIGFLSRILERIPYNLSTNFQLVGSGRGTNAMLDEIAKWTMSSYNYLSSDNIAGNLGNIQRNTAAIDDRILSSNTLLGSINDSVSGINGFAKENTLSGFDSYFRDLFAYGDDFSVQSSPGHRFNYHGYNGTSVYTSFPYLLGSIQRTFSWDGNLSAGYPTIYRILHLLQETLASEDDRKLAENYKENREQAEKDFLNGKSGKTSLGKGDFSNASQVGGALNDTFNMGGAAKVSDFLSGFGSAGTESQSWFSQTTANNLNAVEAGDGTQGVSTFSDDGETMVDVDPDPYNMASIFDRYDWLEGVTVDD